MHKQSLLDSLSVFVETGSKVGSLTKWYKNGSVLISQREKGKDDRFQVLNLERTTKPHLDNPQNVVRKDTII